MRTSTWKPRLVMVIAVSALCLSLPLGVHGQTCESSDPFPPDLSESLSERYPGRRFTATVYDARNGCTYTFQPETRITTASVFKIEVLAGLLWRAENEGRPLSSWEMERAIPMITESANPPTSDLFLSLGGVAGFESIHDAFGLEETVIPSGRWGLTLTSASDQIHLVRQLLLNEFGPLDGDSVMVARDLMGSVIPSQQWGISAGVPGRWEFELKNGFYPTRGIGWRINSVGVIRDIDDGAYAMAIFSDGWSTEAAGISALEKVATILNDALVPRSAPEGIPFIDVGQSDWFYDPVRWAYEGQVVYGTSPITFSPFDGATRGQVAAVLNRFLDLPPGDPETGFTDIEDSVFVDDIAALVDAGITWGCNPPENDHYCPHRVLERGEVAAMLVRALGLSDRGEGNPFIDDDDSVFERDIEILAEAGLLQGCNPPENTRSCPHSRLSRAEIVTFLERVPPSA
ncbi:MAG: hypothetical protein GEU79_02195 [Acidimicrobiia bacterium]|nr:hypothetical protein [Acidimicrobiia bacterium]